MSACECGRPAANHSSRCNPCQRQAVLDTLGWTDWEAENQSKRAAREVAARRHGYNAPKSVLRRNQQRRGRAR